MKALDMVKGIAAGIGYIIDYAGERFEVAAARENGYGAVLITNFVGVCRGMGTDERVTVLGTFNI